MPEAPQAGARHRGIERNGVHAVIAFDLNATEGILEIFEPPSLLSNLEDILY